MRSLLGTAVFLTLPVVFVLWQLVMIAILRPFGIFLPFSFAVHIYNRRERELTTALRGSPVEKYILISGCLLFGFPLLAGIATFDYLNAHYISQTPYSLVGLVVSVVISVIAGVSLGISQWKKSSARENTMRPAI